VFKENMNRDLGIIRSEIEPVLITYCAWHMTPVELEQISEKLKPDEVLSSTICPPCLSQEEQKY
jgi:hypothetical protein